MASLWLRNEFAIDTKGIKNGFDQERHLHKPKNGDYIPNVLKHDFK